MADYGLVTTINTDTWEKIHYTDEMNTFSNRRESAELYKKQDDPLVTIVFQAYNGLEKYTKHSLPAVLKYTEGIDYELILIDNGSTDGTLEYFKACPYKKKRIYRITKNMGSLEGRRLAELSEGRFYQGKYLVMIPNDIIVTKNYLANMLRCAESDDRIGMVVPLTDYNSNYQQIDLGWSDFEDMQRKAAVFNQSNPLKWEERLRSMPTMFVLRMELWTLRADDPAFIYYFSDDDYCFQYRRMGYKLMVCGDVFVHHGETVTPRPQALDNFHKGKAVFQKKYYGIDSWDDTLNFEWEMRSVILNNAVSRKDNSVLGVDVRCGSPLLNLKNGLKQQGMPGAILSAFTEDAKYWLDLKTICEGNVFSGDVDRIMKKIGKNTYDYILLGRHLDDYVDSETLLMNLKSLLIDGGRLVLKIHRFSASKVLSELMQLLQEENLTAFDRRSYYQQYLQQRGVQAKFYTMNAQLEQAPVYRQLQAWHQTLDDEAKSRMDNICTEDKLRLLLSEQIILIQN